MPRRRTQNKRTSTLSLAQTQEQLERAGTKLAEKEEQQRLAMSALTVASKAYNGNSRHPQVKAAANKARALTADVGRLRTTRDTLAERITELSPKADELTTLHDRLQNYTNVTFGSIYWVRRHHVAEVKELLTGIEADTSKPSTATQLTSLAQALSAMNPRDGGAISNLLKDCMQLIAKYKLPLATEAAAAPGHK